MRRKLRHLVSVVFSVVLNSCYVWIMNQEVKQFLDTVENSFLTTMYPHIRNILKSGLLEKYINYRRRHVHVVRRLLTKWKVDTLFECYCKRLFGSAYPTFAVSSNSCVELLRAAITYRHRQWWIRLQGSEQQIKNRPAEWKHAQAGKSRRRWEDMLVDWLCHDCFLRIAKIPRQENTFAFIVHAMKFVNAIPKHYEKWLPKKKKFCHDIIKEARNNEGPRPDKFHGRGVMARKHVVR